MTQPANPSPDSFNRREFLKLSLAAATAQTLSNNLFANPPAEAILVDDFQRRDSFYHGDGWESLNPGYWKIEQQALRRRLRNVGDRARAAGFPYHYETHGANGGVMPLEYDPSLPHGNLYRRDWKLSGNYTVIADFTVKALRPAPPEKDSPEWAMYQPGYAFMGIVLGAKTLFDSYGVADQGWRAVWSDNGVFQLQPQSARRDSMVWRPPTDWWSTPRKQPGASPGENAPVGPALQPGDRVRVELTVSGDHPDEATLTATLQTGDSTVRLQVPNVSRQATEGWFGLTGCGLLDFEVNRVALSAGKNHPLNVRLNECHNCYALGPTLQASGGRWQVRFVALFRNPGGRAEIRVADSPAPDGGWEKVPVVGAGTIVTNEFRINTAIVETALPANPADKTLYYTVWKDGRNVTSDPRLGSDACGIGTGMVGDVPVSGDYVGRLPQLTAPYRLAGLSCHAIHGQRPTLPEADRTGGWFVHDQPTLAAYRHLEDYNFQIMLGEDDVWYLELLLYPPSTDDAYTIINTTISGPATRWQMMRHWNVLNPGDHDYGMDDVKGPEQIAIRRHEGLGQDRDYMRRNFQIVQHLMTGAEEVSATENPKTWRRWKMPNADFTLLVMDSRLWRTSQDTRIWSQEGWGHLAELYDRADPTRALLGEEQFAWLREIIRTDSSPLICLTGINGLHSIWVGDPGVFRRTNEPYQQRDRVAADYASWVAAGAERVLELLGGRDGIVTVYGDVHNGCILKNLQHRLFECSFGPIGRTGGRMVIPGFGPRMRDYDGRELEVHALYHQDSRLQNSYGTPDLQPLAGPTYWNFLEMHFDPRGETPRIALRLRNLIDAPTEEPRGGGFADVAAPETGRPITCRLPRIQTLPAAEVRFLSANGRPIRGARTLPDGRVPVHGLVDVAPGEAVLVVAHNGRQTEAKSLLTLPL